MTRSRWYRRLSVQIVALLTLALLPLGAVAIFQTERVAAAADRNAGLALVAMTEQASRREELVIERAFGAVRFLETLAPDFLQNPERCLPVLSDFIKRDPKYGFIGIIPESGIVTCSSTEEVLDFNGAERFAGMIAAKEPTIVAIKSAPISRADVFVVYEPIEVDGEFFGFAAISILQGALLEESSSAWPDGLIDLITFSSDGTLLASRRPPEESAPELPIDRALSLLVEKEHAVFTSANEEGIIRRYAVAPIKGTPAAVLGVWDAESGVERSPLGVVMAPAVFPILMWIAGLGVAMLALHRLVLRHLRSIRKSMDAFGENRSLSPSTDTTAMPTEILALRDNFMRMAKDVLHDEAKLEDAVREKGVLVKEIHHRVKNNLQLISSIINMQVRKATADETRGALGRLQQRVLSLATIHRDLYQSQDGGRVAVGELAREIIEGSLAMSPLPVDQIRIETDIDPIKLYPDQAVPLSLLLAEAAANAVKYLGAPQGEKPLLRLHLKEADGTCHATLENSIGAAKDVESTGMGTQLIHAFAIQLGARVDTEEDAGIYRLTLSFQPQEFAPEQRDF